MGIINERESYGNIATLHLDHKTPPKKKALRALDNLDENKL